MMLGRIQIAVLSVLLVAASVNSFAVEQLKDALKTSTPTNIAFNSLTDHEIWHEYINSTYHFRFRYPLSAKLTDYGSQVAVVFQQKFDNGQVIVLGFSITVFSNTRSLTPKKLALESVQNKMLFPDASISVIEQGSINIGGREAYQIRIAESTEEYESANYEIYLVKDGNVYVFNYDDPQSISYVFSEAVRERNTAVLSNLFKKMLESFSFDEN